MEQRIYGIDLNQIKDSDLNIADLSDKRFREIAEQQGNIWTFRGFENQFNAEELTYDLVIRFLEVPEPMWKR